MEKAGDEPLAGPHGRILVVDDDRDILFFVKLAFENEGFEVTCAESGEQALELLAERPYSVLLTDQNMPGMSGFELANHARRLWPELTIFMGTGHLYPGITERAAAAGIREVFSKPFDFQRLFDLLRETSSHTPAEQSRVEK
ncbi:response regulator [Geobacter sp.]|uniref:response regulator n=1 Tax=Geobacter sp. TaxID=46610 RepID=UPI001ACF2017|nr:response regulator [Geobacter sp.]CAG0996848.1 Response regulator receiver protein CpdR [Anaerolineales bacterium]